MISIVAVLLTRYASNLNFFFYGVIGAMSVVVVGVIAAPLFTPAKPAVRDRERI